MLKTQDNSTEHVGKEQNGPPEYDDLDSTMTSTLLFISEILKSLPSGSWKHCEDGFFCLFAFLGVSFCEEVYSMLKACKNDIIMS